MLKPISWAPHLLQHLLESAENTGGVVARCADANEARLLRQALYNFRVSKGIGLGVSFFLKGDSVILQIRSTPRVTVLPLTDDIPDGTSNDNVSDSGSSDGSDNGNLH